MSPIKIYRTLSRATRRILYIQLALCIMPLLIFLLDGTVGWSVWCVTLFPITIGLIGLVLHYGWPWNWWMAWEANIITADTDKFDYLSGLHRDYEKEIAAWVKQMSKGRYRRINPFRYQFKRKQDAMAFKLAWG